MNSHFVRGPSIMTHGSTKAKYLNPTLGNQLCKNFQESVHVPSVHSFHIIPIFASHIDLKFSDHDRSRQGI